MQNRFTKVKILDSHTEGEPTRVILDGGPDLGAGSIRDRVSVFRNQFDEFRRAIIHEPRGHEAIVGAMICEPVDRKNAAGVIFFNNKDYLEMCGHGTIGLAVSLHHLGRIDIGTHSIETPVGIVEFELLSANEVTITNVPSYRFRKDVVVQVDGLGTVVGDIAWGGNWFFLVKQTPHELTLKNVPLLNDAAQRLGAQLVTDEITGADEEEIDHIEFFGPAHSPVADSRNFVYCPGGAYDRSPCGTGTSAKLACLADDGKLQPGQKWIQESIVGSQFEGWFEELPGGKIKPYIRGRAYVCGSGELIIDSEDPFKHGIGV